MYSLVDRTVLQLRGRRPLFAAHCFLSTKKGQRAGAMRQVFVGQMDGCCVLLLSSLRTETCGRVAQGRYMVLKKLTGSHLVYVICDHQLGGFLQVYHIKSKCHGGQAWQVVVGLRTGRHGGEDAAFRFQMLFFGGECLEFCPPVKYSCKWDRKTGRKMWHFLLRGCLCLTCTVEIISMVTTGVCLMCSQGSWRKKQGQGANGR